MVIYFPFPGRILHCLRVEAGCYAGAPENRRQPGNRTVLGWLLFHVVIDTPASGFSVLFWGHFVGD